MEKHLIILIFVFIVSCVCYYSLQKNNKEYFDTLQKINDTNKHIKNETDRINKIKKDKDVSSNLPLIKPVINKKPNIDFFDKNKYLIVKETNTYNQIYKCNTYTVWEPVPIDDYYPIGQIVTEGNYPYETAILVKGTPDNKVDDYMAISVIDNKYTIWKPLPKKGQTGLSYIVSQKKPSLNRIRTVKSEFTEKSRITKMFVEHKNKKITKGTIFWNIQDSPYFVASSKDNSKEKIADVYYIPVEYQRPIKKILVDYTKRYKNIWKHKNGDNLLSIWRPIPENGYHSLGDIVIDSDMDPNNVVKTPTIHASSGKPILHFNESPISYKTKDTKVNFWKSKNHAGYTSLGNIVSFDNTEPSNDIVYSIPYEYLKKTKEIKNVWNPLSLNKQKCNIWSNDNFCHIESNFNFPKTHLYSIHPNYIQIKSDPLDNNKQFTFTFNPKQTPILKKDIIKFLKQTLSNKLDITESRISIEYIDTESNKIKLNINKRPLHGSEQSSQDIITELTQLIYKKNGITIKNNYDIPLLIITEIEANNNPDDSSIIRLDSE
jgi:hypothetical protein